MELTNIEQYLPSSFETTNLTYEKTEEENRCLTLRCKLRNAEEVKKWLSEFSESSGTSYILRSSHVDTYKFDYS